MLPMICSRIHVLVKLASVIGPVQTKMVFNIVKFVADVILRVDASLVTRVRPSAERTSNILAVNSGGGCANTVNEGNRSGGSSGPSVLFDRNPLLPVDWLKREFIICWSGLTKLHNEGVSICHWFERGLSIDTWACDGEGMVPTQKVEGNSTGSWKFEARKRVTTFCWNDPRSRRQQKPYRRSNRECHQETPLRDTWQDLNKNT